MRRAARSAGARSTVLDDISASTRSSCSASWMPSGARSISPTRPPAVIPRKSSQIDELRVLVIDEVDDFVRRDDGGQAARLRVRPRDLAAARASIASAPGSFHYAMIAEDVTELPAKTVARTIRNQHPDTVVLTFLGPADNGQVELVETERHAHDRQAVRRAEAAARAAGRARRGVAGEGARAALHAGVPRAALRLLAPLRRDQDEDRARDPRRPGMTGRLVLLLLVACHGNTCRW